MGAVSEGCGRGAEGDQVNKGLTEWHFQMEVPFCFINERSFVQPIDVKNMLRFLSLSVRLLAAALANSPLRGSDRAPQLQLAQTNFTKTCYHFCQSTVVEGSVPPQILLFSDSILIICRTILHFPQSNEE